MASVRQINAVKETIKVLKGESNLTKQELLEKVGYAKGIAKSPNRVIESKGFREILDKYLPDDMLAEKHLQLLNDEKSEVQTKALDMAYKVKGNYAAEKKDININTLSELFNSTLDETEQE